MTIARRPRKQKTRTLYELHPKQMAAMALVGIGPDAMRADHCAEEILFGGQAGGGKSLWLRALAVSICVMWPGAIVPIFRRTYPELLDSHVRPLLKELPESMGAFNWGRHDWTFPNGSVLEFKHCEHENSVYNYQSAEWEALLIDEATHFTGAMVEYLQSRVRSTTEGWRAISAFTSNPGNVGHAWFKSRFIEPAPPGKVFMATEKDLDTGRVRQTRRAFLPSTLADNPSLDEDEYRRRLDAISDPILRRAISLGDWSIFAGQAFQEWRAELHTCKPFAVPPDWPRWVSVDGGWEHPYVALWWTRSREDARFYIYREQVANHVLDAEQAKRILAASVGERVLSYRGDPALWAKKSDTGKSTAQIYQENRLPLIPATNDRVMGKRRIHDLLAIGGDGKPSLQIFETCRALIKCLPDLIIDPNDPEDVKKADGDDTYDALRYGAPEVQKRQPAVTTVPIQVSW